MLDLTITFRGHELFGRGRDIAGSFSLSGQVLPDNRVEMLKKYDDQHHVAYLGEHDGEGGIAGAWSLSNDNGTFAIRPTGGFRSDDSDIPELKF